MRPALEIVNRRMAEADATAIAAQFSTLATEHLPSSGQTAFYTFVQAKWFPTLIR